MGCCASAPKDACGNRRRPTNIGEVAVFVPGLRVPKSVDFFQALSDNLSKNLLERLSFLRMRIVVMLAKEAPKATRPRQKTNTQHGGSSFAEILQLLEDYLSVLLGLVREGSQLKEKVQFVWINQEDDAEETVMSNAWYEVLSVLHLMAMLCLSEANSVLLPKAASDGYQPKVSEDSKRISVDILLKAAGYLDCAIQHALPQIPHTVRNHLKIGLGAMVKLSPCDLEDTGLSRGNNLLQKKQYKAAYNRPKWSDPSPDPTHSGSFVAPSCPFFIFIFRNHLPSNCSFISSNLEVLTLLLYNETFRRDLPVDLAEGVLRALCMQALGQCVDIQLGMAIDSPKATLAVKRRLACEMVKYWHQALENITPLSLVSFSDGWAEKHRLFVKWKYLEAKAAAYYYHGLILDEGNTEKSHSMAVAALQAADEFLKESKKASESFNRTLPTSRIPPLLGSTKYLCEKIPKDASSKVRINRDLYNPERILETAPALPDFALALKPDEYHFPPLDPLWNLEAIDLLKLEEFV